jgi:hypothetical protein
MPIFLLEFILHAVSRKNKATKVKNRRISVLYIMKIFLYRVWVQKGYGRNSSKEFLEYK